jgi:hypothetical protein
MVHFSGCNSAILVMVAPENDGGLLRSPESFPDGKSKFYEVRKKFGFWPDLSQGASIINYFPHDSILEIWGAG